MRYQAPQFEDVDDTALNAVELRCCSVAGGLKEGNGPGLDGVANEPGPAPNPDCSIGRAPASPASGPWSVVALLFALLSLRRRPPPIH